MSATNSPPSDAAARGQAIDVGCSVIVQAPAGSGKTTLLVARYLALLEVVERPEAIVAITFTRKAAAEMRSRVIDALQRDTAQARAIHARSAALNWQLQAYPSRLRILTIDSLATGLVRSLPLASRLGGDMRIIEDAVLLYQRAIDRVFARVRSEDPLLGCLLGALALFGDDFPALRRAYGHMLERRDQWLDAAMLALRRDLPLNDDSSESARIAAVQSAMRAGIAALHERVFADIRASLTSTQCRALADCAAAAALRIARPWPWRDLPDQLHGWQFIAELLTTRSGSPRRQLGAAQGLADRTAETIAMKQRLRELINELDHNGCLDQLHAIRFLPDPQVAISTVNDWLNVATSLALCVIELNDLFEHERCIDFTELTYAAQRALGDGLRPTDLALALDYRIQHLLIDEFQDTSTLQYRLLVRLLQGWTAEDGRTLFAVGDPMQSIYRFRDADVALYQRARRDGIGAVALRTVRLTNNFRASSAMVDWCNATFAAAFGVSDDPVVGRVAFAPATARLTARDDDGCRTCFVDVDSGGAAAEAACVAQTVLQIRTTHPGESIAILARNRNHFDAIVPALDARGIAWCGTDIALLADEPIVIDLMSLLRALQSDSDRLAWFALLRSPLTGLALPDLTALADVPNIGVEVRGAAVDAKLSPDGARRLQRIRPILVRSHRLRAQLRTRQWLEHTFMELGGADAYTCNEPLRHAERFFELLETEHARSVDLPQLQRSIQRLFAASQPQPDAVQVMTIHRSKGLEFDHVLVPCLHRVGRADAPAVILWRAEAGELLLGVGDKAGGSIHAWLQREERLRARNELVRLLYVAATRARYSLRLFAQLSRRGEDVQAPPSRSLLGQIWGAIPAAAKVLTPAHGNCATASTAQDLVLPADYRWDPPVHDDPTLSAAPLQMHDLWRERSASDAAMVGILRSELHALLTQPPANPTDYIQARGSQWRRRLRRAGVAERDEAALLRELSRQLHLACSEQAGWLRAACRDVQSALQLTGIVDDALAHVEIDLTFVDAQGARWIVQVDPTRPESAPVGHAQWPPQEFSGQLRWVTPLCRAFFQEPVRTFVYASAIPQLVADRHDLDFSTGRADNPAP